MLTIKEEQLNMVNGGGLIKEMADKLTQHDCYIYDPGDKVTDSLNPQNGIGTVTKNVGVCGNFTIDEVYFPDVDKTYNQYESYLNPA